MREKLWRELGPLHLSLSNQDAISVGLGISGE